MPRPKKERSFCTGCYHEEYWHGLGGAKECWSYKSGKMIKRLAIPVDRPPPYDAEQATYRLSCFNRKGTVYVNPKVLTSEGYWK